MRKAMESKMEWTGVELSTPFYHNVFIDSGITSTGDDGCVPF